jgi:hypothetical protein
MTGETKPQDSAAIPPASAGSQGPDITVRLRRWTHSVDAVSASEIMDEAAGVIEKLRRRLRLLDAAVRSQPTLTDEERTAIGLACSVFEDYKMSRLHSAADEVLEHLLERTK